MPEPLNAPTHEGWWFWKVPPANKLPIEIDLWGEGVLPGETILIEVDSFRGDLTVALWTKVLSSGFAHAEYDATELHGLWAPCPPAPWEQED